MPLQAPSERIEDRIRPIGIAYVELADCVVGDHVAGLNREGTTTAKVCASPASTSGAGDGGPLSNSTLYMAVQWGA